MYSIVVFILLFSPFNSVNNHIVKAEASFYMQQNENNFSEASSALVPKDTEYVPGVFDEVLVDNEHVFVFTCLDVPQSICAIFVSSSASLTLDPGGTDEQVITNVADVNESATTAGQYEATFN